MPHINTQFWTEYEPRNNPYLQDELRLVLIFASGTSRAHFEQLNWTDFSALIPSSKAAFI